MKVYVEYAFLENFLLDGLLLYLALKLANVRVRASRLTLAAALGGLEAVLFPLFSLPVLLVYIVKFLGGTLPVLVAVPAKKIKPYLLAGAAFFFLTFALGGLLTAVYSFFGIEYVEGNGFFVERAPVSLVMTVAGIFTVCTVQGARRLYRHVRIEKRTVDCVLQSKERTVHWRGLLDSGNLLSFRGQGVCVLSAQAAFALFGRSLLVVGRIRIRTAAGERESPVFCCRLILNGQKEQEVFLTVGEIPSKQYQIILHTQYWEGKYEALGAALDVA